MQQVYSDFPGKEPKEDNCFPDNFYFLIPREAPTEHSDKPVAK